LTRFPQTDPGNMAVGIFGRVVKADVVLLAGDRVEIYRPLIADPKEARRRRAARKR
jgi:putative ubiquitin-RnfH superfamily antitoxin RatB of RatAB toxin-antitoxin module